MAVSKRKKSPGRKKTKKVAKKTRRGRPPGKKTGKKRGRPANKKTAPKNSLALPVEGSDMAFWSELVVFINKNQGKNFIVQMDGVAYSLCTS